MGCVRTIGFDEATHGLQGSVSSEVDEGNEHYMKIASNITILKVPSRGFQKMSMPFKCAEETPSIAAA